MNRRRLSTIFFLSLLGPWSAAFAQQPDSLQLVTAFPLAARFVCADKLGNVYCITTGNHIEKHAPDGRLLAQYSNNRLGAPVLLDVSNPLKVLVWYQAFGVIQLLDRNMTELGALNLNAAGYPDVRTVASAQDGNLWFYDEIGFKLHKISPEGTELLESQPMNMALEQKINLRALSDDGARVFALDTLLGMLVFNPYAQFQYVIKEATGQDFQVEQNRLFLLQNAQLLLLDFLSPKKQFLKLPDTANAHAWMGPRRLMVTKNGICQVYAFP